MAAADFAYKIVSLAVIVIVIATLTIPIVDDLQNTTVEADNTGYRAVMSNLEQSTVITVGASSFDVGSTTYQSTSFNAYYVAMADNVYILYSGNASTAQLQIVDLTAISFKTLSNGDSVTLSPDGTYSTTISGSTTSGTFDGSMVILSQTGPYCIYREGELFFNEDTEVKFFNNVSFTVGGNTVNTRGIVQGTMDNLAYSAAVNTSSSPMSDVTPDMSIEMTSTVEQIDSVARSIERFDLTTTIDISGTDYTYSSAGASYVITDIGYEVTMKETGPMQLLNLVPLMLIIVAVMFAVGLMRARS